VGGGVGMCGGGGEVGWGVATSSRCICSTNVCLLYFPSIHQRQLFYFYLFVTFTTTCFGTNYGAKIMCNEELKCRTLLHN
jgi:hypothetical protein